MNRGIYATFTIFAAVALTACDPELGKVPTLEELARLKQEVLVQTGRVPYRSEQHSVFKAYFGGLAKLAAQATSAQAGAFNPSLCSSALVSAAQWSELRGRCTHNRFFVCAEEVRAYPEMIASLRGKLSGEAARRFEADPVCAALPGVAL